MTVPLVDFRAALESFCSNPLFRPQMNWVIEDNPYQRPLGVDDLDSLDFSTPLTKSNYFSCSSLAAHRMLCTIYHADLVFLPRERFIDTQRDMDLFYSDETRLSGQLIRPILERHVFRFLEEEIGTTAPSSPEQLAEYFRALPAESSGRQSALVDAILSSSDSRRAVSFLLVQLASDFLSEGSGLARNVLGSFGPIQSNLFKILMDEYGAGEFRSKHSTLYENLLRAHDLDPRPHAYWQYYLTSSLAVPNYIHYLSSNHRNFFCFAGALYYAETTYAYVCQRLSIMIKKIFGPDTETRYFDEHSQIDHTHSRIAFDKIVLPLLEKFGTSVIGDLMRGYREFETLLKIAEDDFIEQLYFMDRMEKSKANAALPLDQDAGETICQLKVPVPVPNVSDKNSRWYVESGVLVLMAGYGCEVILDVGDSIVVPKHRLHGVRPLADQCVYRKLELTN